MIKEIESSKEEGNYIHLTFHPVWEYVTTVRAFVANFFTIGLGNRDLAFKVSLAVTELLENAVKYSVNNTVRLCAQITKGSIIALVENKALKNNIDILKEEMKKVTEGEPLQVYLQKIQAVSSKQDAKVGLGLARIRIDTGARLSLTVNGDEVKMQASFNLQTKRRFKRR